MGCLKVDIIPVCGLRSISVVRVNGISAVIKMEREKIRKCFCAFFDCVNDIIISAVAVNDSFRVCAEYACSQPKIDIGVICMTNLNTECYLQVLDGYLVTIDGCYIKVMKG